MHDAFGDHFVDVGSTGPVRRWRFQRLWLLLRQELA